MQIQYTQLNPQDSLGKHFTWAKFTQRSQYLRSSSVYWSGPSFPNKLSRPITCRHYRIVELGLPKTLHMPGVHSLVTGGVTRSPVVEHDWVPRLVDAYGQGALFATLICFTLMTLIILPFIPDVDSNNETSTIKSNSATKVKYPCKNQTILADKVNALQPWKNNVCP